MAVVTESEPNEPIDMEPEFGSNNNEGCSSRHVANGTPRDIAKGLEDKPVQPHNITFPKNKENGRSFSSMRYQKHAWLEYSVSKDAAYCYPCRFFSAGIHKSDECFISIGYRNWKNATGRTGRLVKHSLSQRHLNAAAAWADFENNQQSQHSIRSTLSQAWKDQIQNNRHYLMTIVQILLYCAFQEIALRGHREGEDSQNRGNFLKLIDLVSRHDSVVKNKIHDGPKNAIYTSHGIQDELLALLAKKVLHKICQAVKEAGFYSIIVDESRDSSKQEQMSLAVRYVDIEEGCVHEHFIAFMQAEHQDAESLSSYIKQALITYDFDINKMVSQGYDGASIMSGHCSGVQTRVREFAPLAVYIHCYAHVLNLVLVDSVRSVATASEFFVLLEALYVLVSSSKIHALFVKLQRQCNPNQQPLEFKNSQRLVGFADTLLLTQSVVHTMHFFLL
ncbi:PREDICTED: zinc finger MYM-type protein 1-like [Amphimedon queenslandica]|nr:PREDICTED: zinc finger MYM-type protein 1-like [Amphimedon queenslandica]|eukprot:XP_011407407.1 PREDICTED: zinc finger MYM-type protein 1-like [Amphimedon queenslandica]